MYHKLHVIIFSAALVLFCAGVVVAQFPNHTPADAGRLLNEPIDITQDFKSFSNTYYLADSLAEFDPETGEGKIRYLRHEYVTGHAFDNMLGSLQPVKANEFPLSEYAASPEMPFSFELISPRTIRIRAASRFQIHPDQPSLMLVDGKVKQDRSGWSYEKIDGGYCYTSSAGSVTIKESPWRIELRDAAGKLLTHSIHKQDDSEGYTPIVPFSYVRRSSDYSTSFNAAFRLSPNEKIFGCGESFTEFNKRGQKVVLYTDDGNGVQNETMYKPVPFYMSSNGYGVFMHTSTPITCDFGKYYNSINSMMIGDDELDLFIFLGEPKDILNEYTNITGKAPMPPLWSFGFWMSRITYFSEEDARSVVKKLRGNNIPSDVIHLDTGWFETDWRCDYEFSKNRFSDPEKMMADFKQQGIRTCLWQLPYFVPKNKLFGQIIDKGLYVRDGKGNLPYEDAVLDFSNADTINWYQSNIAGLLKQGVAVIKVDFGEAAPANGIYASGKTGFYEHNLYPLRYNKAVADISKEVTGDGFIWARSAWAGSQRYPVHWGGDPANTDSAMAATLRGGMSLGLSGFSFWAHDIGGFVKSCPEDLYRRWTPFGMLSSHTRSHGNPPTEPWEYGVDFMDAFRKADEMRYRLMPYIYAQAKDSSERGLPMVRALFVEYPDDPGAWLVDDQYLFGSDILVAPILHSADSRDVYLPGGNWIDYQTGKEYTRGWHNIKVGAVQIVTLVRDGAVIPHIKLAQSTDFMDWSNLELVVFAAEKTTAKGLVCLPADKKLDITMLAKEGNGFILTNNPLSGNAGFTIRNYKE